MSRRRAVRRKGTITEPLIVGMLESSARLDEAAAERRRVEAAESGKSLGLKPGPDGKLREVINISGGYSIGMTQSAQVLAGFAAELALKYAYEKEHPDDTAPPSHKLRDDLYRALSPSMMNEIEADYSERVQRHKTPPDEGWRTAEQVFRSANDYFDNWRYMSEIGRTIPYAQPIFLREAICSVLQAIGIKVRWSAWPEDL